MEPFTVIDLAPERQKRRKQLNYVEVGFDLDEVASEDDAFCKVVLVLYDSELNGAAVARTAGCRLPT